VRTLALLMILAVIGAIAGACIVLFLEACASFQQYPYRARLYAADNPAAPGSFRSGWVIAVREDGAVLFRFDDADQGDHGFLWVSEGGRYRVVRAPLDPFVTVPELTRT
jgi:hypothetical protein